MEVPASCANLGPGFDALAVAVDLPLRAWTEQPRDGARVRLRGEGASELPTGDDNLVWQALTAYCEWAGVAV
ncbi:MAG: homoserine kinase, partial [Actinobacteria bacterium QS_5_72_10]